MLLALDTSTQTMGIALYEEPSIAGEMTWRSSSHHTVELAPAIQELMARCSVKPVDLEVLAVALGPGSFTSLRIGLALAKGLALSLHIPLLGIPTFSYLVEAQPIAELPLLAVLPAGRTRFAVQWHDAVNGKWQARSEPQVLTPEEISDSIEGPTHICGEMTADDRKIIGRKWKNAMIAQPSLCMRRPSVLAEMAWIKWKSGKVDDPIGLAPIYLHIAGALQE